MADPPKKAWKQSTVLSDLPEELLAEILSRFRVRTLRKLRLVCKQWYNLLSNLEIFWTLHHEKSQKNPVLVYLSQKHEKEGTGCVTSCKICGIDGNGVVTFDHSLPSLVHGRDDRREIYEIVPSFSLQCRDFIWLSSPDMFYIYNPNIPKLIDLPEVTPNIDNSNWMAGGVGFDPTRNEYIIVHLIFGLPDSSTDGCQLPIAGCEILSFCSTNVSTKNSSKKGRWRKIAQKCCPFKIDEVINQWGTFVDGVFYWTIFVRKNEENILSLGLNKEKFEIIPPPPAEGTSLPCGSSCGAFSSGNMDVKEFEEKITEASWTKEYSISLPGFDIEKEWLHPLGDRDGDGGLIVYTTSRIEDEDSELPLEYVPQCSVLYYNKQNNTFGRLEEDTNLKLAALSIIRWRLCLYTDNFYVFGGS
nr:F-box protein At3g08750-like [Coffea arabica]